MWEYKQIIVIPDDVSMSPAKPAVQVAHASPTVILKNPQIDISEWFTNGLEQKKVVLRIKSTEKLLALHQKALSQGIPCELIRDAGHNELEPNTITALGFIPMLNKEINKITKRLSIY